MRVLPDVVTLDKTFDYAVPDAWHGDGRVDRLAVGSIVRVGLAGRPTRGWVTEIGVKPPAGVSLQPLRKLTGMGPPADVIDLAGWAAWRWAGHRVSLLRTASPLRVVSRLPDQRETASQSVAGVASRSTSTTAISGRGETAPRSVAGVSWRPTSGAATTGRGETVPRSAAARFDSDETRDSELEKLFAVPRKVTVLRSGPTDDGLEAARAAARQATACQGAALIVVPRRMSATRIGKQLRRDGVRVALCIDDRSRSDYWAQAAAGATVVGNRTAVWMPMPRIDAVLVIDEHDEALQEQYALTWHARDVALERARRAAAPVVLMSPVPSLEALEAGSEAMAGSAVHRRAWPNVVVADRRHDDPVRGGLFAEDFRRFLAPRERSERPGRVAAVLNRKGRSRLLACKSCGELVCTADGAVPMILVDDELVARDGSERRPVVCASCGSTVLRNLRMGVTRAREELEALAREPVGEVTATTATVPSERIIIGTEAVLWRLESAQVVIFLDFDQELLAPRQRAAPQAMALLARAARLVGGRNIDRRNIDRPQVGGRNVRGRTIGGRNVRGRTIGGRQVGGRNIGGRNIDSRQVGGRNIGGRLIGRVVVQTRQPDHPVIRAAVRGDPSIVTEIERARRESMGLPPYGAQARVSGAGATDFVDALSALTQTDQTAECSAAPADATAADIAPFAISATLADAGGVVVRGPVGGKYLLRAANHDLLLNALARTPRGGKRLRIEVDPLRI